MDMEQWARVRRKILIEKRSKRSVMKEEELHWETLQKMLAHSTPPGYRRSKNPKRKVDAYRDWIAEVLRSDMEVPRKQRHSAKRIWDRLREEHDFDGGYTVVKEVVAELKMLKQEVFVPLSHRPGEAQVDFGHALVNEDGVLSKKPFFVMSLPYSDAFYVQVFERENTETFWEGHVRSFRFFGAVPTRISYDNSKVAVAKLLGSRERKLTDGFLQLQSHYLFGEHFCLAGRGNEKGVVEGIVKYSRANFLVPVPQVRSLEELNARLEQSCRDDLKRTLRGKPGSKEELLAEELKVMRSLPLVAFEACRVWSTRVNNLSLVRFDCNDYSVPVRYAYREVVVKGDCERVHIYHGAEKVAGHQRIWRSTKFVLNRSIICPCWSIRPELWTSLFLLKTGSYQRALPYYGVVWKPIMAGLERGSISECCACWRSARCLHSNGPWNALWKWAALVTNSLPSTSMANRENPGYSGLMAGNI